MAWPFSKKRASGGDEQSDRAKTMADFMTEAAGEIDAQIAADPEWFSHLPYQGAMSRDAAREFEVEKRALWRRVIHDAGRGDIAGLRWVTREDKLVCPACAAMHGRVFDKAGLAALAAADVHLGCRCELVPVRP